MKEFYADLPGYVKNMTSMELKQYFPMEHGELQVTNAYLIRSIIMNEKVYHSSHRDNRTLRGVWYQVVKPTLDKLGLLTEVDSTEEGLTKWDKELSRYMGQLLRKGLLMYSDLGIIDSSRRKDLPATRYSVPSLEIFGFQVSAAPYPNIIIATEKDTVYDIVSSIANLYGCSCISAKGQNALGAMEFLIKRIMYQSNMFEEIFILSMTDYDPAGYYIADALVKQAKDILNALGYPYMDVKAMRIGITPEQLDQDTVYSNMYTPKPANRDKWMDLTGGIDGMEKGLELDALDPSEIRRIFTDNLKEFIDNSKYESFIRKSFAKSEFLEQVTPILNDAFEKYYSEVATNIEVSEVNMQSLAMDRRASIPVHQFAEFLEYEELDADDFINKYIK